MTDYDALLASIIAVPNDRLPRLVFADFLEERGSPEDEAWAKFIRQEAVVTENPSVENRDLAYRLWSQARGLNGWGSRYGIEIPFSQFSCGFIEVVSCTSVEWLDRAHLAALEHPIRKVILTDRGLPGEEYSRWPGIEFELKRKWW